MRDRTRSSSSTPTGASSWCSAASPRTSAFAPAPGVPAQPMRRHARRRGRRRRRPRRRRGRRRRAAARGAPGAGINGDSFNRPSDVTWDRAGNIYVADGFGTNNRIAKFTKDGNFVKSWGQTGSAQGQFNQIRGIASDAAGNIYVADAGNNRIQVFDGEGTFKSQITQHRHAAGHLHLGRRDAVSLQLELERSREHGQRRDLQGAAGRPGRRQVRQAPGKLPKEFGMVNAHRLPDRERPLGGRSLELAGAESDVDEVAADWEYLIRSRRQT